MVFIGGPRQVGKTTLALQILGGTEEHPAYFNYDDVEARSRILKHDWPSDRIIVLDELHKYARWKQWLKGTYDTSKSKHTFLVTGSARLDIYRRGGDSMFGRYHYYRLHPFSVAELIERGEEMSFARLLEVGGFPEPYFSRRLKDIKRWRMERRATVVREDLRELERVFDLARLELLAERLTNLVGNPLSINGIAQDLEINFRTAAKWIEWFERMYYCYRIYPYGTDRIRAVKKEAKLYLWDWGEVSDPGFRFENMVAGHLLKYCHFVEDTEGERMELRYLRDTDGREVDFVVLKNRKPIFAVECKLNDIEITKSMNYFRQRTPIPKFYLVHSKPHRFTKTDSSLESIGAEEFLKTLV